MNAPHTPAPRLIRVSDCPPQAWKNGGGITHELLTLPNAANWVLRISVADITQNGAFSSFAGVQRSFAVIEGHGVELRFAHQTVRLTQASEPLQFDGAAAPDCALIDGATRDLNLMCQSGYWATLVPATAGQTLHARGFFNKAAQSLLWFEKSCNITSPSAPPHAEGTVGWWVVE